MRISTLFLLFNLVLWAAILGGILFLCVLAARVMLRWLHSQPQRRQSAEVCRSLGQAIRAQRTRCRMTQEFVAEALGVSRQAVSKWETGQSDPSTANLIALAELFGLQPEELLRQADSASGRQP